MFKRYTRKAHRVIFFASYEASLSVSPWIGAKTSFLGFCGNVGPNAGYQEHKWKPSPSGR